MSMAEVLDVAKELGTVAARARTALPELAMAVAENARAGLVEEEDANEIYAEYARHAHGAVDPRSGTFRANASKLRTIIRCASEHRNTLNILDSLEKMHAKESKLHQTKPLYETMVWACRRRLEGKDVGLVDMLNELRK
jgi:hypothetical protein